MSARPAAPSAARTPPASEAELLQRAYALSGQTVGELGVALGVEVPPTQHRAKGLTGTLIERALGASAGSRAEPDFPALGVELKTIPLDARGVPRESTFVCSIDLSRVGDHGWERSVAHKKLARVLWVPIEASPELPLPARRIGRARLWSPSAEEAALLRADWDELIGRVAAGEVEHISAHLGQYLQVRPKAADSKRRRRALDENAAPISALPRGFYLRTRFTRRLFASS